jgi:cell division transport system permease protein
MKVSGVKYLIEQGVDNVWKNRMMAFASFCVLLVSLLLVGLSVLLYYNVNSIIGGIEEKNEVIVYLDDDTDENQLTLDAAIDPEGEPPITLTPTETGAEDEE